MIKGKNHVIIAFEGLDNCFKETNYNTFVHNLELRDKTEHYKIHTESFPRYSHPITEGIKEWLHDKLNRKIMKHYPAAICSTYSIDRFSYWYENKPDGTMNSDYLVPSEENQDFHYFIFDRYSLSNALYNPIFNNDYTFEDNFIQNINFDNKYFGVPNPNIVVWMRAKSFDVLSDMIANKTNKDKNEMDLDFLHSVWLRSEYMVRNKQTLEKLGIKLIVIDILDENNAVRDKNAIAAEIWHKVTSFIM